MIPAINHEALFCRHPDGSKTLRFKGWASPLCAVVWMSGKHIIARMVGQRSTISTLVGSTYEPTRYVLCRVFWRDHFWSHARRCAVTEVAARTPGYKWRGAISELRGLAEG